ncbi:hypothetical protein [Paracoccus xiamenensis]|uniref:hypothetical protein n=1 Tax=Paracoccus xiamenensis TaxID=2714901 RepID=UPI00140A2699|nr:hypothetical protein [Paracoccus xiamenensis]NHF73827.1 hypothetical protein [Paracoccus xiamenensis]
MSGDYHEHYRGGVRFVSPNGRLLRNLSLTLGQSIPSDFPFEGTVYVCAHALFPETDEGVSLGIQTEQYYDENGAKLWGDVPDQNISQMFDRYDHVLDWSYANKGRYEGLTQGDRLHFGPWVFPNEQVQFVPGDAPFVFFGNMAERRRSVLRELAERVRIDILPKGSFGEVLSEAIRDSQGILNVHFDNGIYSEVPRILTAYHAGKAVVSEPLAQPFEAGKHYIPLDDPYSFNPEEIFRNMEKLAARYRFAEFLKKIFPPAG